MPMLSTSGAATARAWGLDGMAVASQVEWTVAGTYAWVVPHGVKRVSGVAVGCAGANGGGLHWRNAIPVLPGETLTVIVALSAFGGGAQMLSALKRGATYLLRAEANSTYFATLGGGGGAGGTGAHNNTDIGGGGAGGYMGNGGSGVGPDRNAAANSGGGNGGFPFVDGGGVGLQGRTADFAVGSRGLPKCGGGDGTVANAGQPGGVRLMWGNGRSYPDAAVDV